MDIKSLKNQGYSVRKIASIMGISRITARKAPNIVSSPKYEERMPSKLDPFKDYIKEIIGLSIGIFADLTYKFLSKN